MLARPAVEHPAQQQQHARLHGVQPVEGPGQGGQPIRSDTTQPSDSGWGMLPSLLSRQATGGSVKATAASSQAWRQ